MLEVAQAIGSAYQRALGPRLVGVAVHWSAVTGDSFPGFSDADFLVLLGSPLTLNDSLAVAAVIELVDIAPFSYVQAVYTEVRAPASHVVPGAFVVLRGAIEDGFLHTNDTLRRAGEQWLEKLPTVVDGDVGDWSVSVGRRKRQLRLVLTRLKPTVRALLVRDGLEPLVAYREPWPRLLDHLRTSEPDVAEKLGALIDRLHIGRLDPLEAGGTALECLVALAPRR